LIAACVSDALAEFEAAQTSLATPAKIETELWNVYHTAMGNKPFYVIDPNGMARPTTEVNLSAAKEALSQLRALSKTSTKVPSSLPDDVDPAREAWDNYRSAKANRDEKAAQFWFASWCKLKEIEPPEPEGNSSFPWQED
jgi:hypothetical protein